MAKRKVVATLGDVIKFPGRKKSATEQTEASAKKCGLTIEQWVAAKGQAKAARTRGRKEGGSSVEAKLAGWQCEGQEELW